jgi:hypothetical protein
LAKDFTILFIFSKNQFFVSLILCIVLFIYISLISILVLYHLFPSTDLGFYLFLFSKSSNCIIRLFTWELTDFFKCMLS